MKKEILLMALALLLAMSLVATGCPGPEVEEQVVEEQAPPETEEPDPHIVQRGNLVASYKYSGGVLLGAEVFASVENRGGAGFVKVVFVGGGWTDREIIFLESGETKCVSGFVPHWVIRPPGHTTGAGRRIEITATARPVQSDIDSLIRDLDHEDSKVRKNAAFMLGLVGEVGLVGVERAIEPLIKALEDEDSDVRRAAAEALGKIGDARAVEPLILALKDRTTFVREAVGKALVKIGEPAVEPLILALKGERPSIRRGAAIALGEMGDARAVEPLKKALNDGHMGVRAAAREALRQIEE